MKKILFGNKIYLLIITLILVVQLYFSLQYRIISQSAEKINREYARLMFKSQNLKTKISGLTSYIAIERKAKQKGFTAIKNVMYLSSDNKLAQSHE